MKRCALLILAVLAGGVLSAVPEPAQADSTGTHEDSIPPPATQPVRLDGARLWQDLAVVDPATAHEAVAELVLAGDAGVAVLEDACAALLADVNHEAVARLIRELDDADFATRERASQRLADLAPLVVPQLREALATAAAPEARARLREIVKAQAAPHADSSSGRRLNCVRWALELAGTARAKQLMARLDRAGPPAATQPDAAIREPADQDLAVARRLRDGADLLCAEYRRANRPGPPRKPTRQFILAAMGYHEAMALSPMTEVDAYCLARLSGLYMYAGRCQTAVTLLTDRVRRFAGGPLGQRMLFELGLTYLQLHHNPARAMPYFEKVVDARRQPVAANNPGDLAERAKWTAAVQQAGQWTAAVQQSLDRCRRELADRAEADKTPWAKPTDGVQCRLRPDKAAWPAGKSPAFNIDAQNTGKRDLWLGHSSTAALEVQVDGQWYAPATRPGGLPGWFGPDCQRYNFRLVLGVGWLSTADGRPLGLPPGKHTVRAVVVPADYSSDGKPLRAESDPVEIEVLPPQGDRP